MKNLGFAIIELLVVVAVVSAIFAITVVNFPKVGLLLSLSRVSNNFAEEMRRAQQMALSGAIYRDSSGIEHDVSGYGIYVDLANPGNKKYLIYADKSPGNKKYDTADYLIETVDFSSSERGVKFKQVNNVTPADQASVNFNASAIETTITQLSFGQNHAEFVFSLDSDDSSTKKVWVNTAGLIEVK